MNWFHRQALAVNYIYSQFVIILLPSLPYNFFLYFTYHSAAITKILLINKIVKNTLVPVGIWCEDAQPTTPIKHRAIKIREKRTIPSCSRTLRVAPLGLMILLCILCYKKVATMGLILLHSFRYFHVNILRRTSYTTLLHRHLESHGYPQAQCCQLKNLALAWYPEESC